MMERVMDDVLVGGDTGAIWIVAGSIFLIFLLRGGATYMHTIMMNAIGQNVVAEIQKSIFNHCMALDLKFFYAHPSGELLSRVVNDTNVMRTAVTDSLTGIGKSLLTLIFLVAVMFYQDWQLAIASFIIFPFAAICVVWIGRRLRKMSGRIQENLAGLSHLLAQIFQGIRLVKAYGMETHEQEKTGIAIDQVKRMNIKAVRVANLSTPVNELLVGIVVFGIIVYGGYGVAAGETTAGELMSFITAFIMSYEPMKKLAKLNNSMQIGLGAADRVFDILDAEAHVFSKEGALPARFSKPSISFENVSFHYDDIQALDSVSFAIPSGQVTALVGRSGGGKSTIMNLIPRFYDVSSGAITIEGQDVRDYNLSELRQNIALVSQDITIFDESVWANIGYGTQGVSQDDIIQAAKAAEADAFIAQLPEGYETRLGQEGLKLSGGQRQRIAIARAILRDAPILLLDEATSALDNEVERAIQETLAELQKGRTTLVIAHRLSTVQKADQILVIDKGQVVEEGNHQLLIEHDGLYKQLYGEGLSV